VEEVTEVS